MNIAIEYKDKAGVIHNKNHRIIQVVFAKHLALSGRSNFWNFLEV